MSRSFVLDEPFVVVAVLVEEPTLSDVKAVVDDSALSHVNAL